MNPKHTNKSPIHENTNAKIACDFGDERFRIAAARLENNIFVRTHLHTSPIVVMTMRVPVQRAVERDEIPCPYKVNDTTLRPLLNITIKS